MKKKKLLYALLCALGGGTIGLFANSLTNGMPAYCLV